MIANFARSTVSGPCYGDCRLVVFSEYDTHVAVTYLELDRDVWPMDAISAACVGLAPFMCVTAERCTSNGPFPLWESIGSARILPAPGWAARGAAWCRVCGCVAHDGAEPTCAHANFERRP